MNTQSEGLRRAFDVAQGLKDKLKCSAEDSGKPLISIDELQEVVAREARVDIDMRTADFEAQYLRGRVERWGEGGRDVRIHVRANLSWEWQRFVAAKELLHPLVDRGPDLCPYGDDTLDELIRQGHFGLLSIKLPSAEPVQSEVVAEIAALEALYPLERRAADMERLHAGATIVQIAPRYGIPTSYVATALDPLYLKELGGEARAMAKVRKEWFEARREAQKAEKPAA